MDKDNIEKWIQEYLRGEGNNIALADGLLLEKRFYFGPVTWKLSSLIRCCRPEEKMKYRTNENDFNQRVNGIINRINNGWEMPPLLVNYENKTLTINDGNHRHEAYNRLNKKEIPVIFWITKREDYQEFMMHISAKKIN